MDVLKGYGAGVMSGNVTPEQARMILGDLDKRFRISRKRPKELQESKNI